MSEGGELWRGEPRRFSQDRIQLFSLPGGVHTSREAAQRAGHEDIIIQGTHMIPLLSELLLHRFGAAWAEGGYLNVALVRPVPAGETLAAVARVSGQRPAGRRVELTLAVWLENQAGEAVVAGEARLTVDADQAPPPPG